MRRNAILFGLALVALSACDSGVDTPDPRLTLTVSEAPEWNDLFDRDEGWTGADGIFAVSLDGVDDTGSAGGAPTLFLFSDTAIGNVLPDGSRAPGIRLISNSLAVLRSAQPDPAQATFIWRETAAGEPAPIVRPDIPQASASDWYWNQDAVVLDGRVYSLHLRISRNSSGFPWRISGVSLVSYNAQPELPEDVQQVDTPFFLPPGGGRGDTQFGAGIMANTVEAGAPQPDGFVYVYGVRNDWPKKLLVARVAPGSFADLAAWRFWDGAAWQSDIVAAAPIADRISNELSVSPLADGRFILVHQLDAIGPWTAVRIAASPVGPWGEPLRVYKCPEVASDPDTFCYNAKGFPHLSARGELLISYNVNTRDFFGDWFADADIYRPRFIRLHGLPL